MDDNEMPSTMLTPPTSQSGSRKESVLKRVFIGPNGLRAGWRLLAFVAIAYGLVVVVSLAIRLFHGHVDLGTGLLAQLTPLQLGEFEGTILFFTAVAAWIM